MSGPSNGSNGYTNGNYTQEAPKQYDDVRHNGGAVDGSRERREGGLGGFGNDNSSGPEDHELQHSSQRGAPALNTNNSYTRPRTERGNLHVDNGSKSGERNKPDSSKSRGEPVGQGSRQIEGQ